MAIKDRPESLKKVTKAQAIAAILAFLAEQEAEGAQTVYFGALPTDDDEITLADLLSKAIGSR
jgi:hypothetical protein